MELTVIGNQGPYPGPGTATSGYLLTHGPASVLLDCGSGVLGRLETVASFRHLSALVLTHLHFDHFADALVLRYALESDLREGRRREPLPVYLPEGPEEHVALLKSPAFDLRTIRGGDQLQIGELQLQFYQTVHSVPSLAVSIRSGDAHFCYSSDTGWDEGLAAFARDADLFLCEAAFCEDGHTPKGTGHLTAREAGELGHMARAKRLVITHFRPGRDIAAARASAMAAFADVEVATPGARFSVDDGGETA